MASKAAQQAKQGFFVAAGVWVFIALLLVVGGLAAKAVVYQ